MNLKDIEKHGYLKLIEFTLENSNYSIEQACDRTGLNSKQFQFAKHEIFVLSGYQDTYVNPEKVLEWELSPKAYFQYLEYLEFKHAIESSKKATRTAIAAITISGILGLATLITSLK